MIEIAIALAIQSEPPPYLQYMEEAEALGRATYLGGVCAGMGIIEGDAVALQELVLDLHRRATIDKADGPMLSMALKRGQDREKEAVKLMMDVGPDDGSERRERREAQAVEYFGDGCARLTIDYPSAFTMPDEG